MPVEISAVERLDPLLQQALHGRRFGQRPLPLRHVSNLPLAGQKFKG
jgi:hypothetical protein